MNCTNLDYLCADYGQDIPQSKENETIIQKSLGVLQEDGLFAFVLFLESKKDSKDRNLVIRILSNTREILNKVELISNPDEKNVRKNILEITKNIDNLFLAKNLIEKMLIYARYRAKALKNE